MNNINNSQPLISCIIIFLNAGETFFIEAIESVFAQNYKNWELLLVDDGSNDESSAIALQYVQKYPEKVRYLEHPNHQNRGMSASRNLGVFHAKGEYIAFLDADDIWLPQKLEKQISILAAYPEVGMVYGSSRFWFSWTGKPEDVKRDRQRKLGVTPDTVVKSPALISLFLEQQAETPGTCSVLLRRDVVKDVGGFEESFRGMFEDQAFFYKVCLKFPVFVESGCWDRYRQHSQSSCSIAETQGEYNPEQPNYAYSTFLNWLEQYLLIQEITDQKIWQALRVVLLPYRHPYYIAKIYLSKRFYEFNRYMKKILKLIVQQTLPISIQNQLKSHLRRIEYYPSVGKINFGDLRRLKPVSQSFGYDRGLPIDRYYIENFLAHHAEDIRGNVLEIGDNFYTMRFGGDRITKSDVLHIKEGNTNATIIGDLANSDNISADTFDCLVLTQTLHFIYDIRAAVKTIYRILKPGGIGLITVPGISQISVDEWQDYWCWSFTAISVQKLFVEVFPPENLQINTYGNVLAATSFLQGLATEELRKQELDEHDPSYQVLITIRCVKSAYK
ncbi:family 2 glycosyl transferase [Nostoc carneum NIES-2107]|nr:family 2 glycosyl transferase [Nostoc carneum NIES-2107]